MDIETNRAEYVEQPAVVTAQPVVRTVQEPATVVAEAPVAETVVTARSSWFTPAAVAAGVVAVLLLLIGGITVARAGLDSTLDDPVVSVAGFSATAILGLILLGFGVILLAAALSRDNGSILFIGILGGVAALVGVFQSTSGEGALALERDFALVLAIAMGVVVAAALLPTVRRSSVVRERVVR